MHKPAHYQYLRSIVDRLTRLAGSLDQETHTLMNIGSYVSPRQLRQSIYMAAEQCRQYSNELYAQVATLGYTNSIRFRSQKNMGITRFPDTQSTSDWREQIQECRDTEARLIEVYGERLRDRLLMRDLKNLLHYQRENITATFFQMKTLDLDMMYCSEDYKV